MFKYYGTELNMRRYELLVAIHGIEGIDWNGGSDDDGLIPKSVIVAVADRDYEVWFGGWQALEHRTAYRRRTI